MNEKEFICKNCGATFYSYADTVDAECDVCFHMEAEPAFEDIWDDMQEEVSLEKLSEINEESLDKIE